MIRVDNKEDDSEALKDHKYLFWDDGHDPRASKGEAARQNLLDDFEENITDHMKSSYAKVVEHERQ